MKKYLFISALALVMMASCKTGTSTGLTNFPSGNLPSVIECDTTLMGVKGVHLICIDDYSFEQMVARNTGDLMVGGCSEVRKGNFVARNLDWYQLDEPVYIIRIGETDKHLASMAVCALDANLTHESDITGLDAETINLMVSNATDGMNSAGVYMGINVCPGGEMSENGGDGAISYSAVAGGVNADKPALQTNYVLRMVLDHATSVEEAKKIILGTNWKDSELMAKGGFQMHWMIADMNSTCVCEFIDGKPVFIDAAGTDVPDYGNIMTNFSNCLMKNHGTYQNHGAGYERFNILKDNYAKCQGLEGAIALARSVFFSRAYTLPLGDPEYFWSDWGGDDVSARTAVTWADEANRNGEEWTAFLAKREDFLKKWNWRELGYDIEGEGSRGAWYTTHSSIWNIQEKSLLLDIEEQDQFCIAVGFDGKLIE